MVEVLPALCYHYGEIVLIYAMFTLLGIRTATDTQKVFRKVVDKYAKSAQILASKRRGSILFCQSLSAQFIKNHETMHYKAHEDCAYR